MEVIGGSIKCNTFLSQSHQSPVMFPGAELLLLVKQQNERPSEWDEIAQLIKRRWETFLPKAGKHQASVKKINTLQQQ